MRPGAIRLWSSAGVLSSLLNGLTYTQRTLCGSLENTGLLQWFVFAAVPNESPSYVPSLSSHVEEFLLSGV